MNKLIATFRLIKTLHGISKFNNIHSNYHRKAKKTIKRITAPYSTDNSVNIPTNAGLKMQWYVAEFIYICEKFNYLTEQRSTKKQRRMYLLSGILVAMSDMIIDDIEMPDDRIKLLKRPASNFEPLNAVEKLYVTCYNEFINSLAADIKQRTIEYYELLFDAQFKSKQQFDNRITQEEVDLICKEKCGYSMLFLRSMVKGKMSAVEKEAWFELGAFVQYCNDTQDLYKDLQKNMRTFASTRPGPEIIAKDLDKQKTIAFALIKKTHFQKERKDNLLYTLNVMSIAILAKLHAFSRICNYRFSFEKLLSKNKKEVRAKLKAIHLVRYGFPKILHYNYESVDKPYRFKDDLTIQPFNEN